jgi:hypothetical protein
MADGKNVVPDVWETLDKIKGFSEKVQDYQVLIKGCKAKHTGTVPKRHMLGATLMLLHALGRRPQPTDISADADQLIGCHCCTEKLQDLVTYKQVNTRSLCAGAQWRVEGRNRAEHPERRGDRHRRLIPGPPVRAHGVAHRPGNQGLCAC